MYLNRLTIMGFLGNDAEKKTTASGKTCTVFSLATDTSWKDGEGKWQHITDWHRVVVWGDKFAESAARLTKGAHVLVEGSLRSREYERDGARQRVWECKADSIVRLDRAQRGDEAADDEQQSAPQEEAPL